MRKIEESMHFSIAKKHRKLTVGYKSFFASFDSADQIVILTTENTLKEITMISNFILRSKMSKLDDFRWA